jgi:hypothetical protein
MPHARAPHHYNSPIREEDLGQFAHLVTPSGAQLLRSLGRKDGLVLINRLGGCQLVVPKGPTNNPAGARLWAHLCSAMGEPVVQKLAAAHGGEGLEVPTLHALRVARRNAALCTEFDRLTARPPAGEGLSKARAVQQLGLSHGPITWRQIEVILDTPPAPIAPQQLLF